MAAAVIKAVIIITPGKGFKKTPKNPPHGKKKGTSFKVPNAKRSTNKGNKRTH